MKKQYLTCQIVGLVIAIYCVLFVSGCGGMLVPLPYRSLDPFKGRVVETGTDAPIEGAVVLAVYYATVAGIAGSNSYVVDGQETVTDKEGEFVLPRTRRWFVLDRGYPEGCLVIFKAGHGLFPDHTESKAVGVNKSWPPPGKYIEYELPKLSTKEERKKNLPGSYSDIPYNYKKQYIHVINLERKALGAESFFDEPEKEQKK